MNLRWIVLNLSFVALMTACAAPQKREAAQPAPEPSPAPADAGPTVAPVPASELIANNTLDPSDVIKRSKLAGCQLIPYDSLRETCVNQNDGLHGATACGAPACQRSAGHAANVTRRDAWQNCVDRRTLINGAFNSTLSRISEFKKKSPVYKGWAQNAKTALATLVGKIEEGQPGHDQALDNAKETLATCKSMT